MKYVNAAASIACLLMAAGAVLAQDKKAGESVKGEGCVEAGVTAGCLIVNAKDKKTYNLFFTGNKPAVGKAITFEGAVSGDPNICQQGTAVKVSTWKETKMACPPGKERK